MGKDCGLYYVSRVMNDLSLSQAILAKIPQYAEAWFFLRGPGSAREIQCHCIVYENGQTKARTALKRAGNNNKN